MRNLKLVIRYDGTRYRGWQRQREADPRKPRTIQGKLEELLSRLTGERVALIGASRTDAGVHAEGQVANFHTTSPLPHNDLLACCARHLPEDIAVVSVEEVTPRFHARYLARRKRYAYRICTTPYPEVFRRRYTLHHPGHLDPEVMRAAAGLLIGEHDFRSFTSLKSKEKSTVRILRALNIEDQERGMVLFYEGDGFLYNMIRIITGTLLEVGHGRLKPQEVGRILEASDRSTAGPMAPALGLCLLEVLY
jgi:tRNA pseudouridine38-40 synthase